MAALVAGAPIPGPGPAPDGLDVSPTAWMRGLAEAASELRRHLLDRLREGDLERGESLLGAMDDVYDALVAVDYPDALTNGLRRTLDALRAVLERSRGDVTTTVLQTRLQRAIECGPEPVVFPLGIQHPGGGSTMAITHIGRTTIYVDDQDRAKAFYTDVLGFELVMDMPMGDPGAARWIEVRPPGGQTNVVIFLGGGDFPRPGGMNPTLFETDDIKATFDDLKARALRVPHPARVRGLGQVVGDVQGHGGQRVRPGPGRLTSPRFRVVAVGGCPLA